jgi:hypothetical protein
VCWCCTPPGRRGIGRRPHLRARCRALGRRRRTDASQRMRLWLRSPRADRQRGLRSRPTRSPPQAGTVRRHPSWTSPWTTPLSRRPHRLRKGRRFARRHRQRRWRRPARRPNYPSHHRNPYQRTTSRSRSSRRTRPLFPLTYSHTRPRSRQPGTTPKKEPPTLRTSAPATPTHSRCRSTTRTG